MEVIAGRYVYVCVNPDEWKGDVALFVFVIIIDAFLASSSLVIITMITRPISTIDLHDTYDSFDTLRMSASWDLCSFRRKGLVERLRQEPELPAGCPVAGMHGSQRHQAQHLSSSFPSDVTHVSHDGR